MSFILMKILEKFPEKYEAGISKITSGEIEKVRNDILKHIEDGDRVLDVGCGAGTFAILCAKKGADVVAIDISPQMIELAKRNAEKEGVEKNIQFYVMDAKQLSFEENYFDAITSILAMSELRDIQIQAVFNRAWHLLKDDGMLIIADEVVPADPKDRRYYKAIRAYHAMITYIRTRSLTYPIRCFEDKIGYAGFEISETKDYLRGTLRLIVGKRLSVPKEIPPLPVRRYSKGTAKIAELLCNIFGIIAKVPIQPGLYKFGNPDINSPVFVTANYYLTFCRVRKVLEENQIDCYLLVADTRGINVWCSAEGGSFNAKSVMDVINATRIDDIVEIDFNLKNRFETGIWNSIFATLILIIPFLIFWRDYIFFLMPLTWLLCFSMAILFYLLPTKSFLGKGATLGVLSIMVINTYLYINGASLYSLIDWALGLMILNLFLGVDYAGVTPVSSERKVLREFVVLVAVGIAVFITHLLLPDILKVILW